MLLEDVLGPPGLGHNAGHEVNPWQGRNIWPLVPFPVLSSLCKKTVGRTDAQMLLE